MYSITPTLPEEIWRRRHPDQAPHRRRLRQRPRRRPRCRDCTPPNSASPKARRCCSCRPRRRPAGPRAPPTTTRRCALSPAPRAPAARSPSATAFASKSGRRLGRHHHADSCADSQPPARGQRHDRLRERQPHPLFLGQTGGQTPEPHPRRLRSLAAPSSPLPAAAAARAQTAAVSDRVNSNWGRPRSPACLLRLDRHCLGLPHALLLGHLRRGWLGGAHTHTFTGTAIDLDVQYVDAIIASKD